MLLLGRLEPARARARRQLYDWRWLHRFALAMGPAGFVAVIAGWVTTEVGRQPYTVYGLLRTADSASPLAGAGGRHVARSPSCCVYFVVFGAGIWYILRLMAQPPHHARARRRTRRAGRAQRASRRRRPVAAKDRERLTCRSPST